MTVAEIAAVEILRLHTDEQGCVWYGDDDQLGINTYLDTQDFFDSCPIGCDLDDVKCVRFLGTKANAPLVVELQRRRAEPEPAPLLGQLLAVHKHQPGAELGRAGGQYWYHRPPGGQQLSLRHLGFR